MAEKPELIFFGPTISWRRSKPVPQPYQYADPAFAVRMDPDRQMERYGCPACRTFDVPHEIFTINKGETTYQLCPPAEVKLVPDKPGAVVTQLSDELAMLQPASKKEQDHLLYLPR